MNLRVVEDVPDRFLRSDLIGFQVGLYLKRLKDEAVRNNHSDDGNIRRLDSVLRAASAGHGSHAA